jgi:hypothetical protein
MDSWGITGGQDASMSSAPLGTRPGHIVEDSFAINAPQLERDEERRDDADRMEEDSLQQPPV